MRDRLGVGVGEGRTLSGERKAPQRFAGLILDLDACTLVRESGETIALTRGEFALLRVFVSLPGRVLSRDTLLDATFHRQFEPFDRSVDVLVGRLRRKIESDPKEPRVIVTVPGEGYRFDGLAKALASMPTSDAQIAEVLPDELAGRADGAKMGDRSAIAPRRYEAGPPRLSIVVLPFANMSDDLGLDYFVDGVTETLTTDLSRIRGAVVIARNTAFTYKGKPLDVKIIGRELNVRYVLEGSVQRNGSRMRVSAQLIDAESGHHLWAERFDKPLADLFDMQDEIVARLAGALNAQLVAAEARLAEQSPNPDSMDLYFQGLAWLNKGRILENIAQARGFFDNALTADPDNVDALIGSAAADAVAGASAFVANPMAAFAAAEAKLTKALSSVPDSAGAHMTLGYVYIFTKRAAEGIAEGEHALALNRNLASAHALIGYGNLFVGRAQEAEFHIAEALRLSPRDTMAYTWMFYAGIAKSGSGSYEQAVAWFRRSIEANRNFPHTHFHLASALALLDRLDEARSAVKAGLALNAAYSISRDRAVWAAVSDHPTFLPALELLFDGLRKAGLPEE
jgi:TolB-like protein/DNA-binding winged helix-turn-helix (wHTH) protein/Flp pilus assembly protein TadD